MINKNRLMGAIVSAGMSQRKLAQKIGMSKNTINAKINGVGYFNTEQIDKICTALDIRDNQEKALIFLSESSQNRDKLLQGRLCDR